MLRLAEYITVAIAATLKFVGGPIAGAALQLKWWETTLSSAIGLMITVFTVIYGGEIIKKIVKSFRKDKPRRIFTKPNRLAIKVKNKLGLWGIAILTPFIFTPLLGSYLALSFRFNKVEIMWKMLISGLFAGLIQTLFFQYVVHFFR
ncbi:MAG: hypothetical protein IPO04_22170 [Cytophagaceae bacterium]|nr:hypothetical protein [Cytophagaceae bacterium]